MFGDSFWPRQVGRTATKLSYVTQNSLHCPPLHWSKNFNIDLRDVTFGTHLRKHLRLLVGYCQTSVTGSHARLDHNVNSELTWSLETSIPQDFSVIEILQNEKYITKCSKYSTSI